MAIIIMPFLKFYRNFQVTFFVNWKFSTVLTLFLLPVTMSELEHKQSNPEQSVCNIH